MHPLNTFPELLDFVRISPFLLRVVVGVLIIYLGRQEQKKDSFLSYAYYICGLFLMVGFYTQITSIVGLVLLKYSIYVNYWKDRRTSPVSGHIYFLYAISGLILVSLLFSGAGFLALDMPF